MADLMRAIFLIALLLLTTGARGETQVLRIGMQPGMSFLALVIMQHDRLIEAAAAKAGLPPVKVEWTVSANGTVVTDGLLSGNLDICATGMPAFIILWAKGKGLVDVKGIASHGAIPGMLVTRNPAVKTIADFTNADRIAVPAVKASIQSILIAMAAEKLWGPGQQGRIDPFEISLSHPDALIAMLSGHSEINAHFSSAPYYQAELRVPNAHVVLTKEDIFPGQLSHGLIWTGKKFHDSNPVLLVAFRAALEQAMDIIHTDAPRAARAYLALAREKVDPQEAEAMIRAFGPRWESTPHGVFPIASFMYRIGMIKIEPKSWQDLFFEEGWVPGGS